MKPLTSSMTKALPIGARLQCVDNTGAREIEINGKILSIRPEDRIKKRFKKI